jgi:hypothetical protein
MSMTAIRVPPKSRTARSAAGGSQRLTHARAGAIGPSRIALAMPAPSAIISRISDSLDLADDAIAVAPQFGIEFACVLLHALVLGEAGDVPLLDAGLRAARRFAPKLGADAMAVPGQLDAEGGFGLNARAGTSAVSSETAGLVHPGITDIALQQCDGSRAATSWTLPLHIQCSVRKLFTVPTVERRHTASTSCDFAGM